MCGLSCSSKFANSYELFGEPSKISLGKSWDFVMDTVLCALDEMHNVKDSCGGDSGGEQ